MMRICPICGRNYDEHPSLSRKDCKTEICPTCGMAEAIVVFQEHSVYTAYSEEADITFIMEDRGNTTSVVGFYYGEPDEEATKRYRGKLVAEFE